MKLLFTGGTGFLGKNVRPILEKQYELTTCGITPEDLVKACFFIAGIDEHSLLQAVNTAVTMNRLGDYGIPVPDYVEENVSTKVVKIIQSYTGIVNKMV